MSTSILIRKSTLNQV